MKYQYQITSSGPLKLTNNGGSPAIVLDYDGANGDAADDLLVGNTQEVRIDQGWGFDLSITRKANLDD